MKKIITILILLAALASLTRCKVYEIETIDEIPCPGVGIDSILLPPWNPKPGNPDDPSVGH